MPQILAPLFSLYAALQLGRREDDALSLKWHLLFIPAVLLIGGVLINDLHHMAFRAAPDAATLEADYTHGWVYYLAMTWIVGLLLATGIIVYRKCRISESRRYAWAPLCVFLGGFMLCALSFANIYTFHKMPECFCLTFAAFWESCLQVGLLPTNGHYRHFFSESTVAAPDCGRAWNACIPRKKCARAHARSAGSNGAQSDSPECGHAASERAGARMGAYTGWRIFQKPTAPGADGRY